MATGKEKGGAGKIRIRQVRSGIGRPLKHRRTLEALGLRGYQRSVVQDDTAAIRGMIFQVSHLVEVADVTES